MPSANLQGARGNFLDSLNGLLGSGGYTAPSLPSNVQFKAPTGANINLGTSDPRAFLTGAKPPEDDTPWYLKALMGANAIGKSVTDTLAQATSDDAMGWYKVFHGAPPESVKTSKLPNFFDLPVFHALKLGAKGQLDAWTDGKFGAGDIPGLGALYGLGKNGGDFGDTLVNTKLAKPDSGLERWGGLAGDILLDPTTYLSGGMGAATKAGKVAEAARALELAGDAGLNVSKRVAADSVPEMIFDATKAKYAGTPINQDLAERLAIKKFQTAQGAIEDAGNMTRTARQNDLLAFQIPFTKTVSQGFGTKPGWFKLNPAMAGTAGMSRANNVLEDLGLKGDNVTEFLNRQYGVDSVHDLTAQMLGDLNKQSDYIKNPFLANDGSAKAFLNDQAITDTLTKTNIPNPKFNPNLDANLHVGAYEPPFDVAENFSRTAKEVPFEPKSAQHILNQFDGFTQDAGGKSKIGAAFDKINPFNARTLKSADAFVNNAANHKADAQTKIMGQSRDTENRIQGISKDMQNFNEHERAAVIHSIEGEFPKSFPKSGVDMGRVNAVAGRVKTLLSEFGKRDSQSGTVKELLQNYFPHVMRPDMENLLDNPEVSKLLNRSKSNQFGKQRKGFDTLAQWKNAIEELQSAGKDEEALQLSKLYESDPIAALGQRAYKSIRSSAINDLYGRLEKDGLLHKIDDVSLHASGQGDKFRKLTEEEAKAFGLPEQTVMHREVIEGMKDLKDMFTSEGMSKFFRTVGAVNNVWKGIVTMVPSHHINNFIGNVAVTSMAGVTKKSYSEAGKLLKSLKDDVRPDVLKEAIDRGVISQGFISDVARDAVVKSPFAKEETGVIGKLNKAADWTRNNKAARAMTHVGDKLDNYSRLALFIHGMDQTGSAEKAAGMVRKYLFNYSEMTHADRAMKEVFPFWNWVKNNIPLQFKSFAEHQGYMQTVNKTRSTLNEDVKDGNPSYKTEDYVHIPGTSKGVPLRLPMNDLGIAGNPIHLFQELGSMLTPMAKVPVETGLNRQFFNQSPIYKDETQGSDLLKYLANQLGPVGKAYRSATDGFNPLDYLTGRFTEYK